MKMWVTATVVLLLLGGAVLVLAAYGTSRWAEGTRALRSRLVPGATTDNGTVNFRELADLPAPVQRYLRRVLVEGSPVAAAVRVRQVGEFNMGETGDRWKPFSSDQLVTIRPPGLRLGCPNPTDAGCAGSGA